VDAALKAIDAFDGRVWIVLGGKDKGGDYRPLIEPLKKKAVAALVIGAAAAKIEEVLRDSVPVMKCERLETAVRLVYQEARAGDVVLLAPACSSFDQFDNYEHRGRVFKELVQVLKEKET
jgi:UDP-N-acetylmuramoylalanine--D-glutamate ligase